MSINGKRWESLNVPRPIGSFSWCSYFLNNDEPFIDALSIFDYSSPSSSHHLQRTSSGTDDDQKKIAYHWRKPAYDAEDMATLFGRASPWWYTSNRTGPNTSPLGFDFCFHLLPQLTLFKRLYSPQRVPYPLPTEFAKSATWDLSFSRWYRSIVG